jgi:hypothetical protein
MDGFKRSNSGPPPYLKSPDAWMLTLKRLKAILAAQRNQTPLVLVAPAPIFGYESIDGMQRMASAVVGPYPYDQEGWGANLGHLYTFLLLCGDADIVVISGDVHYAFTSTAKFLVFDGNYVRGAQAKFPGFSFPKTGSGSTATWEYLYSARFIQLTSSAAKNFASSVLSGVSTLRGPYGHVVDRDLDITEGAFKDPKLYEYKRIDPKMPPQLVEVKVADKRPNFVLQQRINDAGNTQYEPLHNIGFMQVLGRRVDNGFLVDGVLKGRHSWDFATNAHWEPAP